VTIEQDIYDGLNGYAGLEALVSDRIYEVQFPEGTVMPCVTYQRISGPYDQGVPGNIIGKHPRYQLTAWSDDRAEADEVAEQLELAAVSMIGSSSFKDVTLAGGGHVPDPDAALFASRVDAILLVAVAA